MKPQQQRRQRDPDSQYVHRPKRTCAHYAQEVRESEGSITDVVEQQVRRLLPWARQNALGLDRSFVPRHPGWSPAVKVERF